MPTEPARWPGRLPGARGSWGHAIRAARFDERTNWTSVGTWIARLCGRRCGEPVVFRVSYYVTGVDQRPRLVRRFVCPEHARRFGRRHDLGLPAAVLPVDQVLLPFGGT